MIVAFGLPSGPIDVVEHLGVGRSDDGGSRDGVGIDRLTGDHGDGIPFGQLVEPVEGRAVGGAVARHPEGAVLPGQDGAGDVARPLAQLVAADPLDHDLVVELDLGDVEHRQGLAAAPPAWGTDLLGVALGGHRRGRPLALQLVAQVALAATGHGVGPDELVDEEVEDEASHPDERPARSAKQPPHHHLRTAGGQVEVVQPSYAVPGGNLSFEEFPPRQRDLPSSCPRWPGSHRSRAGEQLVDPGAQVVDGEAAADAAGAAAVPGHEPGLGQARHRPVRRHPAAQALPGRTRSGRSPRPRRGTWPPPSGRRRRRPR